MKWTQFEISLYFLLGLIGLILFFVRISNIAMVFIIVVDRLELEESHGLLYILMNCKI